jgi:hypothetical protein
MALETQASAPSLNTEHALCVGLAHGAHRTRTRSHTSMFARFRGSAKKTLGLAIQATAVPDVEQ